MTTPNSKANGETAVTDEQDVAIENLTKTINKRFRKKRNKWTLIVTFLALVLIIVFITIAFLVSKGLSSTSTKSPSVVKKLCKTDTPCNVQIVETIPSVLKYAAGSPRHDEISKHWNIMINQAAENIDILSFYWSMNGSDVPGGPYKQAKVGEEILLGLQSAAQRGVKVRIVQNVPSKSMPQTDTKNLAKNENVEVRTINMRKLVKAGIIHTKVIIVDKKHMYVGSANFDWRALTEVKELGSVLYNCSCAGQDVQKIFEVNWMLAVPDAKIPSKWPKEYQTDVSKDSPLTIEVFNNTPARIYFSTSPPAFLAGKRTSDIDAILDIIQKAKKFIHIAVMDYYAAIIYQYPKKYWSVIDTALREAVFNRGIEVNLLTSRWNNTNAQQIAFLKSLKEFGKMPYIKGTLQVKLFTMPWTDIPYSRVNHNKYMVTDNAAFISTSNWSGDYFISTGGVSLIINQTDTKTATNTAMLQEQLRLVFSRDWTSDYAKELV